MAGQPAAAAAVARRRAAILDRRASLIAAARTLAGPVVSCVQARVNPGHLIRGRSWDELAALVIVLAEAADPAVVRELGTVRPDDGRADVADRERMLRTAHTQADAWRKKTDQPVPAHLAILEAEYYRWRKQEQRAARATAPAETSADAA